MANSKFDICNVALTRIGANTITSFEDGSTEAIVAGQNYDLQVEAILCMHRWRFASKQAVPNRLLAGPTDEYQYYFQIPADCLQVQAVKVASRVIEFDRYDDKIACDAMEIVLDYTFRPDESKFPAHFTNLVVQWLQSIFNASIRRDQEMADKQRGLIEQVALPRAKAIDSMQQSARRLPPARLIAVRG